MVAFVRSPSTFLILSSYLLMLKEINFLKTVSTPMMLFTQMLHICAIRIFHRWFNASME